MSRQAALFTSLDLDDSSRVKCHHVHFAGSRLPFNAAVIWAERASITLLEISIVVACHRSRWRECWLDISVLGRIPL